MSFLNENIKNQLKNEFDKYLNNEVKIKVFSQEIECQFCKETRELVGEVASLSNKLKLEVFNFVLDKGVVEKYRIDKIPAIVIEGEKDYGIRFYGIPFGYEFNSLIEAIKLVSSKNTDLKPEVIERIKKITKSVNIQIFVTLTCPYCPAAVKTAHKFAFLNDNITSSMIEAQEFPHLASKYEVFGVPKTIINDKTFIEGAPSQEMLLEKILEAL